MASCTSNHQGHQDRGCVMHSLFCKKLIARFATRWLLNAKLDDDTSSYMILDIL